MALAQIPTMSITQNDNKVNCVFTVKQDGKYESLAGHVVDLQCIDPKTGRVIGGNCEITDPAGAECRYILYAKNEDGSPGDTSVPGEFNVEVHVTSPNGKRLTHRNPFKIIILPEIVPDNLIS